MTGVWKLAAVVASITLLVMPAVALPLHCILMTSSGDSAHPCQMMGMNSPADQIKTAPSDQSCCQVSAARTESIAVLRAQVNSSVAPTVSQAFLSDVPAGPVVHEPFDWNVQLPGGPPQAVLCTFLI
jgi:hypothetical protein